jgi:hypothetical protein
MLIVLRCDDYVVVAFIELWLLLMMKPLLVSVFVSRSNEEEWNRDWVACGISRHFLEIGHVMRVL